MQLHPVQHSFPQAKKPYAEELNEAILTSIYKRWMLEQFVTKSRFYFDDFVRSHGYSWG